MKVFSKMLGLYSRLNTNRLYREADDKLLELAKSRGESFPQLSKNEIAEIKRVWPCFHVDKFNTFSFNRLTKRENGFSPYYINTVQFHALLDVVNQREQVVSLTNKAMCDVFLPDIPFPKAYVRCINGLFYNTDMSRMTFDEVVKKLMSYNKFICKPSIGSSGGAGVKKITVLSKESVEEVVRSSGNNWIAQEVLQQEQDMAIMNPTSINCCRITTLFMKGHFGYSAIVKIGKKGSNIDNWFTSYFVGLSSDGKMNKYGYDKQLNKVDKTDSGVILKGTTVNHFNRMLEIVEKSHKHYFPMCGIVGWDIMADMEGNPRVVETNLTHPGVIGEQLGSGPFFESFHDTICDIVKKRRWV